MKIKNSLFITIGLTTLSTSVHAVQFPATANQNLTFSQKSEIQSTGFTEYSAQPSGTESESESTACVDEFPWDADLQNELIAMKAEGDAFCKNSSYCSMLDKPSKSQNTTVLDAANISTDNTTNTTTHAATGGSYCYVSQQDIPKDNKIPFGNPLRRSDWPHTAHDKGYNCGWRINCGKRDFHDGIDLGFGAQYIGIPVFATADGVVTRVRHVGEKWTSAGNAITIKHAQGFSTFYCHLKDVYVKQGDTVKAGCAIGTLGTTGGAKAAKGSHIRPEIAHLHYQIDYTGNAKSVKTQKGTTLPIKRGGKGTCINPTQWVNYKQ